MCINSAPSNSVSQKHPYNSHNIRLIPTLNRWRRLNKKKKKKMAKMGIEKTNEMEMKNLKLFMENQSIIKENERLRNKALLLHQENLTLLAQLQHNFSINN
ncbi:hypothetical protein E1A91_A12G111100v1 [Gossypium mustelinum]|uniref:Uncharacterized protein n=1 Tax=Gossypium mustelinum TaxID=34275 RepID=A0A5D2WT33_GOSMU|nr:hypothetical protein E1A91_A12G111100v1 [Gossypium mustelinum]